MCGVNNELKLAIARKVVLSNKGNAQQIVYKNMQSRRADLPDSDLSKK